MATLFENDDAAYVVLVNGESQHALWPDFAEVPGGWRIVHGPAPRADCLEYVRTRWTDMTPLSLR
jgi:MbtH protein